MQSLLRGGRKSFSQSGVGWWNTWHDPWSWLVDKSTTPWTELEHQDTSLKCEDIYRGIVSHVWACTWWHSLANWYRVPYQGIWFTLSNLNQPQMRCQKQRSNPYCLAESQTLLSNSNHCSMEGFFCPPCWSPLLFFLAFSILYCSQVR